VVQTAVGFSQGGTAATTYELVCTGSTGHNEVVQVVYDPSEVSYEQLLDAFWAKHDPTTLNRQGGDVGTQYRCDVVPCLWL
jgi:peptide-methionine (S)-S-oxide reductase